MMSIWDTIFYISSTVSFLGLAVVVILTVLIHMEDDTDLQEGGKQA